MQTFDALLCATLGGLFGGAAHFAGGISFANERLLYDGNPVRFWPALTILACNGIIGLAGSAVGLLLLLLFQKFPSEETTENLVLLASVAVVGGFGGRRFLPLVVLNVEETFARFQREADLKSEQLEHRLSEKIETTEAMAKITRYAFSDFHEDGLDASYIKLCEGAIRARPDNAHAYVALARLYRRKSDLPKAIMILTRYLQHNSTPTPPDAAWNTVFYNRACYHSLLYKQTRDRKNLDDAIADLSSSQKFAGDVEADREFAKSESDFDTVKHEPAFAKLLYPA